MIRRRRAHPWGDPDLQGTWTNTTTTPLERPAALAGKDVLSAEERAAIDEENAPGIDAAIGVGAYNNFWMERGYVYEQTSLVVDPPDGRLPRGELRDGQHAQRRPRPGGCRGREARRL